MEIKDLFSHKIHSSGDDWPDKLIELAFIFEKFDNRPYDRDAIENELSRISPRASIVARDPSKFRDEISAYPAYLGLYRIELVEEIWHFFLSNTAKQFLVCEEPNVAAFMMLQMALFQYPNGMGVAYTSHTNKVRVQANTRDRTLEFINNGVHLSPFRLICKGLLADAELNKYSPLNATISFDEIFTIANHPSTRTKASPDIEIVKDILTKAREKDLTPPVKYESRFHILKHTDLVVPEKGAVRIRDARNEDDAKELLKKFHVVNSLVSQFDGFDEADNSQKLIDEIRNGSWGKYFDGVSTLDSKTVRELTSEHYFEIGTVTPEERPETVKGRPVVANNIYELRKRDDSNSEQRYANKGKSNFVDPEATKIKRQRSNLNHKILLQTLHEFLEGMGAEPLENEHIDLFAKLPSNEKYIFEVKSTTDSNLLSQTRKGVSQLYEYRFRYQHVIGYDVNLCLVFPCEPSDIPWLQEYLCIDRDIAIIWFSPDGEFGHSSYCSTSVAPLLNAVEG
jgi:hypothetical protein